MRWAGFIALLAAACSLGTGSFAGKTCKSNVECPDPYVCALVRPEGRSCELVRGVETFDPSGDNPATYCDVRPVLERSCISNCHGSAMDYPGTPRTFRLDRYEKIGAIFGAGDKAFNINDRIQKDTMPPVDQTALPRPTNMEKGIVLRWLNSGAPNCPSADAGSSSDGGSGDGGTLDGGDGG